MPRIGLLVASLLLGVGLPVQAALAVVDAGDNAPPEAVADQISTAKGTPGDTDVLVNDVDPDDDLLTIESWTQGTDGSVTCAGSVCVYTPDDPSFTGTDSFTYTVADGSGGTDVGNVFVTVTTSNGQPVADDDELTTVEDTQGSVDVLDGDTDEDGDPLIVTTPTPSADHGTAFCTSGGICTYTPDADFNGSDTFSYEIDDGQGGADTGDVAITVTPANDDPNAVGDSLTAVEDTEGSLDVAANDTDIDGDVLTVATPSPGAAHGTVSCLASGACTYTPDADYKGPDSFEYSISDGNGGTDTATVSVTVTPENVAPVADDETLTTEVDTPADVNVLAGDADADGDTLAVDATSDPDHGSVACDPAGTCTYTPDAGYLGADSFTYTVSDGSATDEGLVSVTVEEANVAPGCGNAKPSRTTLGPVKRQFLTVKLSGASDANGDPLAYAITAVRQDEKVKGIGGSVDKAPDAKRVSGKPAEIRLKAERDPKGNGRVYRIVYRVSDGRGGTCTGVEKVGVPVKAGKKAIETAKSFNSFG